MSSRQAQRPVADFPIAFAYDPDWAPTFDLQLERVRDDIRQARAARKLVIYLSCPISARGGGHQTTNVEIARFVASRLIASYGDRAFVLNPCMYQNQSKEGQTLVKHQLAKTLKSKPKPTTEPGGEDYMRMWTRALVERGEGLGFDSLRGNIDAFYFLAPRDVHEFFLEDGRRGGGGICASIEAYLARKLAVDRESFEPIVNNAESIQAFVCFYALKASAAFSKGSHDEWNIFVLLNEERMKSVEAGGPGALIPGYFDGQQIDPASAARQISPGYAKEGL